MIDVSVAVVPLLNWNRYGQAGEPPGPRADIYFTGPKEYTVLNMPQGNLVHKTNLFQMPKEKQMPKKEKTGFPAFPVKEDQVDALREKFIYHRKGSLEEYASETEGDEPMGLVEMPKRPASCDV